MDLTTVAHMERSSYYLPDSHSFTGSGKRKPERGLGPHWLSAIYSAANERN